MFYGRAGLINHHGRFNGLNIEESNQLNHQRKMAALVSEMLLPNFCTL